MEDEFAGSPISDHLTGRYINFGVDSVLINEPTGEKVQRKQRHA